VLVEAACGSGGGGGTTCNQGESCTAPTACRNGAISCSSGAPVCVDSGNAPDGTACGSGGSCAAGACKRAVSGTFQTLFWPDNGTTTTVATSRIRFTGDELTPVSLLVPDASAAGYTAFPLALDASQSFRVAAVPVGSYFLEMETTRQLFAGATSCNGAAPLIDVKIARLFDATTSTPDLSAVTAARPDLATATAPDTTQVTYALSGLQPFASSDRMLIVSSQARTTEFTFFQPPPVTGATDFTGTEPWFTSTLPDAAKGDVAFVFQRSTSSIANGAASIRRPVRFARLTNFTVADGATSTATASLTAVPQTASLGVDLRGTQFAAMAAEVNPSARLSSQIGVAVFAIPHSVTYPDMPTTEGVAIFSLLQTSAADTDFGTLTYGRFLDSFWQETRSTQYFFDVTPNGLDAAIGSTVPVSALTPGPIVPILSPPKSPRVSGNDGFAAQTGVGLQPTISWSPPALGKPTSYQIRVFPDSPPCALDGQMAGVEAVVHGATSFKVPPGVLKSGIAYRATITAQQAPWDAMDAALFRSGEPFHFAECVTATFTP